MHLAKACLTKRLQPTGLVCAKARRSAREVRPAAEARVVMRSATEAIVHEF